MHIGRIRRSALDGPVPRLVEVRPDDQVVIDLATAESLRLQGLGAEQSAAVRICTALFPGSLTAALQAGDVFTEAVTRTTENPAEEARIEFQEVEWLCPVDPPVMRDASAFEQHLINAHRRGNRSVPAYFYEVPVYYKMNPFTLVGSGTEVGWCAGSRFMDYELELAAVIGRSGRDLAPEDAEPYIFGYTIMNDFSARDIQAKEMSTGFGPAKSKDFSTSVGPWVTTADSLDPAALDMIARVNGEERSRGSSSTMMWSFPEMVAYLSQSESIAAGEVLGSGTVGLGSGLELFTKLQPGDHVELEISGIGQLGNRVGPAQQRSWEPSARTPSEPPAEEVSRR